MLWSVSDAADQEYGVDHSETENLVRWVRHNKSY